MKRGLFILSLIGFITPTGLFAAPLQTASLRDPSLTPSAGGGGDSFSPFLSSDGRYVLFASTAQNLVLATNGLAFDGAPAPVYNVYRRDRLAQSTVLATPGISGHELGNNNSIPVGFSTNGAFALVESTADNLVPGDTNLVSDIFLRDLSGAATVLISVGTNGVAANGASFNPVMTPDARYVAFASTANNLVANDTNNVSDVFLRDLQAGTTTLISTNIQPSGAGFVFLGADFPQLSADGQKVTFIANVRKTASGQTGANLNVRDVANRTTIWASAAVANLLALGASYEPVCFSHVFSEDATFIAFQAGASSDASTAAGVFRYNLSTATTDMIHKNPARPSFLVDDTENLDISADGQVIAFLAKTNSNSTCVLVWDAASGLCTLASANLTNGLPASSTCQSLCLDPAARWVSFMSSAQGMVTNNLSGDYHLYQRDLSTSTTTLLNVNTNGGEWPVTALTVPVLSQDGRFVAFECLQSQRSGLATSDVFVLDRVSGGAELISRRADELPSVTGGGLLSSSAAPMSRDGQWIVFSSPSGELVQDDQNGCSDVFARHTATETNLLVSVSMTGAAGLGPSFDGMISRDGRYVVFTSAATNLVPGDNNRVQDVFVRDLQSQQTTLASLTYRGGLANSNSSALAVSQDGRCVLFRSFALNSLAANEPSFTGENLFIRDMQVATNFALTATATYLGGADMTPDGRFVLYSFSYLSGSSVRLWDQQVRRCVLTNTLLSLSPIVALAPDASYMAWLSNYAGTYFPILYKSADRTRTGLTPAASSPLIPMRFSPDAQWLVFSSVVQGTNQLYLRDLANGTNLLVSHTFSSDLPAAGDSDSPSVSPDGRFVVYRSFAPNIAAVDGNSTADIFLFDRTTGSNLLLSATADGSTNGRSTSPAFSADGQVITFSSWASNLHPLDFNQRPDIFVYRLSISGGSFFVQAVFSNGTPTLIWPVAAGTSYRVQFKDDLVETEWQNAPGTYSINGGQAAYSDPAPSQKKFFRVVVEQP